MKVEEHFKELKKRSLIVLVSFIILAFVGFYLSDNLINWLLKYYEINAYVFSPMESINNQVYISFLFAFIFSTPLLFYQTYLFCKPAIEKKVKISNYITASVFLTVIGFFLGFTFFSKTIINSLLGVSLFESYLSLSSIINMSMSIGFSMALCLNFIIIIPFLSKVGLINTSNFWRYSPHLIIGLLLFAGIITPSTDIFSQAVISLPMFCSIGIGSLISKINKEDKIC